MFNTVMLELTYRCNLACSFCYLRHCGRLNGAGAELATGQLKKIIKRFKPGTDFYLTGGEPLLRSDIAEIAAFIKKSGSRFGIITNGTLLRGEMMRKVAALSPEYVMFSLHGPEALHDRLSGKKGAWRALVRNMAAFSRLAGPRTEIIANCVVCRENAGSLAAVYRIAEKAGAHRALFSHLQFLRPGEAPALKGKQPSFQILLFSTDGRIIANQHVEELDVGKVICFGFQDAGVEILPDPGKLQDSLP